MKALLGAVLGLLVASPIHAAQECAAGLSGDSEAIRIKAVGDMVLGSDWPENRYESGVESRFFAGVSEALSGADILFGNLEATLTASGKTTKDPSRGTQFAFRMPPAFGRIFKDAGFTVLNIANNHTFDFADEGFHETVRNVAAQGIVVVGIKDRIAYHEVKGRRVAWIGFSYQTRHSQIQDLAGAAALIAEARSHADLVIATFHGGAEGSDALRVRDADEEFLGEARGNVMRFARAAVDAGADLVLGHGPHVLRGVECYRGKLIAYSLGNFVGYRAFSAKRAAAISAILEVELGGDGSLSGFAFRPLRFSAEKLPEPDPDGTALHLLHELSSLPPLPGARIVDEAGGEGWARYRAWAHEAGLDGQLRP